MRSQAQPGTFHISAHPFAIALECVEIDHERRRLDMLDGHADFGGYVVAQFMSGQRVIHTSFLPPIRRFGRRGFAACDVRAILHRQNAVCEIGQ